jgi:hypothetical protein
VGEPFSIYVGVQVVDIQTGAGADNVLYRLASNLIGTSRDIYVDFGVAEVQSATNLVASSFVFNTNGFGLDNATPGPGGAGAGSYLNIEVNGGGSVENVDVMFNAITDSVISVNTDLGTGDDTADLVLGGAVDLSTIDADLNLGGARLRNAASYVQAGNVNLGGVVDVDITGGAQQDLVNGYVQALNTASRLNYDVNLGGGPDISDFSFPEGHNTFPNDILLGFFPELRVTMNGADGNDLLTVTPVEAATESAVTGIFDIALNGGAGDDQLVANLGPTDALANNGFFFRLHVRLDGGAGTDALFFQSSTIGNETNFGYDVALYGGPGNDSLSSIITPTGTFGGFFGPANAVVLDGGSGTDTAGFQGPPGPPAFHVLVAVP